MRAALSAQLPSCSPTSGVVTMLWERDPAAMRAAHSRYKGILQGAIEANGGYAQQTIGNADQVAFPTAAQAAQAAIDAQLLLFTEQWPPSIGDLQVSMALHTVAIAGGAVGHSGPTLNRAIGLLSAAHGGQVVISSATQELLRDLLSQLNPTDPPGVQLLDLGDHRLKDLTRPEHIFQLVVPGLPAHFPALRTLDSLPNNLPRQLTPLIGREKQISDVIALLHHLDVSLVTLTGPAGTGKTRLSLQVGAQMLEEQKDGVWFVELATLSTDEHKLVPSSIAETLGVREAPGQAVIETLKGYLRDKEMLLVLDNFEQLTSAASLVSSLLKSAPHLKVLVSSRIALRVYGEREYHVPPLSMPDHKLLQEHRRGGHLNLSPAEEVGHRAAQQVEQYTRYEAVRLFVERAQAVKADFVITADNAPDIAADMRPAGWVAPGHRAGGSTHPAVHTAGVARSPLRPAEDTDRRGEGPPGQAANHAWSHRVELRPPLRRRETVIQEVGHLQWWEDAGSYRDGVQL